MPFPDPLPPERLAVDPVSLTESSVRVTWVYRPEVTLVRQWLVQHAVSGRSAWTTATLSTTVHDMKLTSLEAGRRYAVQVYGVTDSDVRSELPAQVTVTISESFVSL